MMIYWTKYSENPPDTVSYTNTTSRAIYRSSMSTYPSLMALGAQEAEESTRAASIIGTPAGDLITEQTRDTLYKRMKNLFCEISSFDILQWDFLLLGK